MKQKQPWAHRDRIYQNAQALLHRLHCVLTEKENPGQGERPEHVKHLNDTARERRRAASAGKAASPG